jgi:hypothetical protein
MGELRWRWRDGEGCQLMRTRDLRECRLSGGLQVRVLTDGSEMNISPHQNDTIFCLRKYLISKLMYKKTFLYFF